MKQTMRATTFFLPLLLSMGSFSAEPLSTQDNQQTLPATNSELPADENLINEEATVAADTSAEEANSQTESREPFIPTIQISEDLSVSFPVDI